MKYLRRYRLSESKSKESIIDNCEDILIDIHDSNIPVVVMNESIYKKSDIHIEIGYDNSVNGASLTKFWDFSEYISEFSRLDEYMESEGYCLNDGFIYYELVYGRGHWSRSSKSFRSIDELISTLLDGKNYVSMIDFIYSKFDHLQYASKR
jgi:hypothetical protein